MPHLATRGRARPQTDKDRLPRAVCPCLGRGRGGGRAGTSIRALSVPAFCVSARGCSGPASARGLPTSWLEASTALSVAPLLKP